MTNGVLGAPSADPGGEFDDPAHQPESHPDESDSPASKLTDSDPAMSSVPAQNSQPAEFAEGDRHEQGGPDGFAQPNRDEVCSATADLLAAVRGFEQQAHRFHVRAENYEQIIRQMQARIEQLQGDQVQALLKPIMQRLAGVYAQATEASERARARGEAAEKDFEFFAVAIEEALGLVDIESVGAAPSVEFNPSRHHASRTVITDDPSLDRRIQRVLRQGFTYAGAARVFLPAQVCIYRYEPPAAVPVADSDNDHDSSKEPAEGAPVD